MATLTVTRGLPASGKTTWARGQPGVRVNRDDLRRMLHGGWLGTATPEAQVTLAHRAAVEALLTGGVDVICDDTNLPGGVVRELAELATRSSAEFRVVDFTDVPLEECLRRDALRPAGERVGAEAIRSMYRRYLANRTLPLPVPRDRATPPRGRYVPPRGAPTAVLVDLDGTVALIGARSPYDMTRVGEDLPRRAVVEVVQAMHAAGHRIVYCSGRTEEAREATEAWLAMNVGVAHDGLLLRATGDQRQDSIVKAELFEKHLRTAYDIVCVLDDRRHVVRMWRALGLTVLQVDEGDY